MVFSTMSPLHQFGAAGIFLSSAAKGEKKFRFWAR
jgi:hypothetical protein